nr:hypothetical protein [uncultured Deefgea sp.]
MAKISTARLSERLLTEQANFSLVLGGPLFQLLRRARLTDDAEGLLWRRIITISLLAWLPLCLFSLLAGQWVSLALQCRFYSI